MATIPGGQYDDFLTGAHGDDAIHGYGGDDMIFGGHGNDTLVGGTGNDSFLFTGGGGKDVVMDFTNGDVLQIAKNINGLNISSADDVAARVHSDHDGNAVVDLGHGDTVTLVGVNAEDVHQDPHGFFKVV